MRMGTDIRVLEVEGFHQPTVVNYRVPPTDPFYQQLCKFSDEEIYINKAVSLQLLDTVENIIYFSRS